MKTLKLNILIIAVLLSSSCGQNLVDLEPVSSLTPENFYKTESDFESAMADLYAAFQDPFPLLWLDYFESRSDNLTYTNYTKQASSSNNWGNYNTADIWLDLYQIVSKANIIIERISEVNIPNNEKYIAEAHFFRGWAYFSLVRMFGGVPLYDHEITVAEALSIGRSSLIETYAFAEKDLIFAAENLPSKSEWGASNFGRITKHAAYGILGRLYMMRSGKTIQQDDWQKAINVFSKIIISGEYEFNSSLDDIFSLDNEKGTEMVLSVAFSGIDDANGNFSQQYVAKTFKQINPIILEPGTYESFELGDIRRDRTFSTSYQDATGNLVNDYNLVKFYYGFDESLSTYVFDWPVLRYTDVLLMYAEALVENAGSVQQESLNILNQVRNRAGLSSIMLSDVTDLNLFRDVMLAERRSEFMFEGVRWFDLVRSGNAIQILNDLGTNKSADDTWLLFPLPPSEIAKMPDLLPQNPGYQ